MVPAGRLKRGGFPSIGEEIANSVSHGVGLVAALIATPFLVLGVIRRGDAASITGAAVFAGSVIVLKRLFRIIDHSAIFLLIAGTYTPFTLGILRGGWGWMLFAVVWTLAVAGIVLKAVGGIRYHAVSTMLYIGMGWVALVAIRPLWVRIPVSGWLWLIAGGVAYTAGVAFFAFDRRVRYAHLVWHMFVLVGTSCHFVAVLRYAV